MNNYRGKEGLFGFSCSGFDIHWDMDLCSVCSVDFVEKMWESMWGNRWEKLEKLCGKIEKGRILGNFCGLKEFFTGWVEKFYGWIYTWFDLCKMRVLHIFHIAYYYNY